MKFIFQLITEILKISIQMEIYANFSDILLLPLLNAFDDRSH